MKLSNEYIEKLILYAYKKNITAREGEGWLELATLARCVRDIELEKFPLIDEFDSYAIGAIKLYRNEFKKNFES